MTIRKAQAQTLKKCWNIYNITHLFPWPPLCGNFQSLFIWCCSSSCWRAL